MSCQPNIHLVVHHHSDLVWRRTEAEYTRRVREPQILTNLRLLARHPEYRYCFAQGHELRPFLAQHPEHRDTISRLIQEGRIELVGGMMSIADTNLVSGESLVRNYLHGLRFCRDGWGKRPVIGWLMDVFGMSAQLPQILRGFGFRYLYPGRMPMAADQSLSSPTAFVWEGLDGSRIVVACQQADVQTGQYVTNVPVTFTPRERLEYSTRQMAACQGEALGLYCTEEECMDEAVVEVVRQVNRETGSRIEFSQPSAYYATLDARQLPVYHGEFNPEFTGCYTTRVAVKQLNRAAESALFEAEVAAALAGIGHSAVYPKERLDSLWERLFVVQFHDGICGCHTDAVCTDLLADLNRIVSEARAIAAGGLARALAAAAPAPLAVFNPLPRKRQELVFLAGRQAGILVDETGGECPMQYDPEENGSYAAVSVPATGFRSYQVQPRPDPGNTARPTAVTGETAQFETDAYALTVGPNSLRLQAKGLPRDLFTEAGFGRILARRDNGDLWTENLLGHYAPGDRTPERVIAVQDGAVCLKITIEGEARLGSDGEQPGLWGDVQRLAWRKVYRFPRHAPEFSLDLTVDWLGQNTKLAIAFPTAVRVPEARARYGIPFGQVTRRPYYEVASQYPSTLRPLQSSAYARAKGDWPALAWVDYADAEIGLTVANDGVCGHQLVNGEVIVSLLRSPTTMASAFFPGPAAFEHGTHRYRFLFAAHTAAAPDAAAELGARLNQPVTVLSGGGVADGPWTQSFLEVSNRSVMVSALKRAECGQAYVLRLYETSGHECVTDVKVGFPVRRVQSTDLAEENGVPTTLQGLRFSPFQVRTLLLEL